MHPIQPETLALGFIWYAAFLFSTTCHEAAHALAAKLGGDPTAFHGGQVIRERVRSGMAAARARGARIGRPRKPVDASKVAELRAKGASWRAVARELGVGIGTVRRVAQEHSRKDSVAATAGG